MNYLTVTQAFNSQPIKVGAGVGLGVGLAGGVTAGLCLIGLAVGKFIENKADKITLTHGSTTFVAEKELKE